MNIDTRKELSTGRSMPVIGLGSWEMNEDTAETIDAAIRMGYPMIDTSGDYGTQPGISEGLAMSGIKRGDIYIVTKVEETDDAYEKSAKNLEELKLDYVDLILIHRPPKIGAGEDLWKDLIKAREDGMTRDIGVSNYTEEQILVLSTSSGVMPAVNQIEWSPFGWSQRMLDFCNENNIIVQAYSPLTRSDRLEDQTLAEIARKYQKTPAQILIRWSLQMGVVPIPKANKISHLEENIRVFDFELSNSDMARLCALDEDYSALSSKPVYIEERAENEIDLDEPIEKPPTVEEIGNFKSMENTGLKTESKIDDGDHASHELYDDQSGQHNFLGRLKSIFR